ncbi:hypothetical protein DFH09DRAFT_1317665 [Mycena vulgaris]|nr:hypothetical protein DFH09DRAFT_1317665 [Mycena vulgaris]
MPPHRDPPRRHRCRHSRVHYLPSSKTPSVLLSTFSHAPTSFSSPSIAAPAMHTHIPRDDSTALSALLVVAALQRAILPISSPLVPHPNDHNLPHAAARDHPLGLELALRAPGGALSACIESRSRIPGAAIQADARHDRARAETK